MIDDAVAQGIPFRIATKYWMEQLGLPFHPLHINPQNQRDRRHGYADLLVYPKRYEVHWRVWSGGTARFCCGATRSMCGGLWRALACTAETAWK